MPGKPASQMDKEARRLTHLDKKENDYRKAQGLPLFTSEKAMVREERFKSRKEAAKSFGGDNEMQSLDLPTDMALLAKEARNRRYQRLKERRNKIHLEQEAQQLEDGWAGRFGKRGSRRLAIQRKREETAKQEQEQGAQLQEDVRARRLDARRARGLAIQRIREEAAWYEQEQEQEAQSLSTEDKNRLQWGARRPRDSSLPGISYREMEENVVDLLAARGQLPRI